MFAEDSKNVNKYQDFKELNNLKIVNTCSIDYFLFSFWCQSFLSPEIKNKISAIEHHHNKNSTNYNTIQVLIKIIDLIADKIGIELKLYGF